MGHNHNDDHDHDHYYNDTILHANQHVFLRHYIQMLNTCEQGVQYIQSAAKKNKTLDLTMINDCLDAFKSIENANFLAGNLMKKIDPKAYNTIGSYEELNPFFEQIAESQEKKNIEQIVNRLTEDIFPKFISWSQKVQYAIKIHIL